MSFTYNTKTGALIADDKHNVYSEEYHSGIYFYIKERGKKRYLNQKELHELASCIKWFLDRYNCDFGEHATRLAAQY